MAYRTGLANKRGVCVRCCVSVCPLGPGWGDVCQLMYTLVLYTSCQQLGDICQFVFILLLDILCQQLEEMYQLVYISKDCQQLSSFGSPPFCDKKNTPQKYPKMPQNTPNYLQILSAIVIFWLTHFL